MSGLEGPRYALRFQERALRDIDAAFVRLAETVSEDIADEWRNGLRNAVADLAFNPRRHPLAPEPFHREGRQVMYRRTATSVAYRILFTHTGEEAGYSEPPTATILHVRHTAAKPIPRAELPSLERPG